MNHLDTGDWVTRERTTVVAAISAVVGLAMIVFLWTAGHGSVDYYGQPVGTDFTAFWDAARLAGDGRASDAWNPAALNAHVMATHGVSYPTAWMYPPAFLLLIAPLAKLPYLPALLVWQVGSLAAIGGALWLVLRDRRALLIALASPLSAMVLGNGQNAFVTAALLGAGLVLLERRQLFAGALLGGLLFKPQLALLIVPLLLFTRNWRAVIGATASVSTQVGASILLWGLQPWFAFAASGRIARVLLETGGYGLHKSISLFSMMRQWGASLELSYAAQAAGAAVAVGLIWRLRLASAPLRAAALCAGVALATPYLMDYDIATVGVGAAFLFVAAREDGFLPYERSGLAFIWIEPWFSRPAAEWLTLPLGPMATVILLALTMRRHASAAAAQGIAIPPLTCSVWPVT